MWLANSWFLRKENNRNHDKYASTDTFDVYAYVFAMFAASPSPTMDSTKVGGREAAAHLCGGGREAAASIVGDGEAAVTAKTYVYTYRMRLYSHICHDSYYSSYVGPHSYF